MKASTILRALLASTDTQAFAKRRGLVRRLKTRLARICQQWDAAREALICYAQHNAGCSARHGAEYRCRCGWRETAALLRVEEGLEK